MGRAQIGAERKRITDLQQLEDWRGHGGRLRDGLKRGLENGKPGRIERVTVRRAEARHRNERVERRGERRTGSRRGEKRTGER